MKPQQDYVANLRTGGVEPARLVECPCNVKPCPRCGDIQKLWQSKSGWARKLGTRLMDSFYFGGKE